MTQSPGDWGQQGQQGGYPPQGPGGYPPQQPGPVAIHLSSLDPVAIRLSSPDLAEATRPSSNRAIRLSSNGFPGIRRRAPTPRSHLPADTHLSNREALGPRVRRAAPRPRRAHPPRRAL